MNKKFLLIFLAVVSVALLTACQNNEMPSETDTPNSPTQPWDSTETEDSTDLGESVTDGTQWMDYRLNPDGESYYLAGIGAATETDIVVGSVYKEKPVTHIGNGAFLGCSDLTSIVIPDSVTSIGEKVLYGCNSLQSITLPFVGESVNGDSNTHFGYIFGLNSENYHEQNIPASLSEVTVTGSSDIGAYAFAFCRSIKNINISDKITTICKNAFYCCSGLESMTIPDSVTEIGDYVFAGCNNIENVILSNNITTIDYGVFEFCTNLKSIIIPDGVTSIGFQTFYGCNELTSIIIPASVTSIDEDAFSGCDKLTSLTIKAGNKVYHSSGNCIIETESKTLIIGFTNSVIPTDESVTSIGRDAFSGCYELVNIVIPDNITSIGAFAFGFCNDLVSITIPNSVTSLGSSFLHCCDKLKDITFLGTVEEWNALTNDLDFGYNVVNFTVHCENGDISK